MAHKPDNTNSSSNAQNAATMSSSTFLSDLEVKEELYSLELARRAVARAALHLGIESMTEETLEVLADVLLSYLNRTGTALAHLVEASGRTSAHVNVLDALQACRMVSAPVVQRLHMATAASAATTPGVGEETATAVVATTTDQHHQQLPSGTETKTGTTTAVSTPAGGGGGGGGAGGGSTSTATTITSPSADWKGLATFLFGPNWLEEAEQQQDNENEKSQRQQKPGGGKVGPSDDPMDVDNDGDGDDKRGGEPGSGGDGGKSASNSGGGSGGDDDKKDGEKRGASEGPSGRGVGGKFLSRNVPGTERRRRPLGQEGWNAPFFDDVPAFPRASETCANPHALPRKVGLSLHRKVDVSVDEAEQEKQDALEELDGIPDAVFGTAVAAIQKTTDVEGPTAWGNLKRKQDDAKADGDTARPSKRVKLDDVKASDAKPDPNKKKAPAEENKEGKSGAVNDGDEKKTDAKEGDSATTIASNFAYVPTFYPSPPSIDRTTMNRGRTVVDLSDAERQERQKLLLKSGKTPMVVASSSSMVDLTVDESQDVRSSLVQLDQYWGSGWDEFATRNGASRQTAMAVPMGRPRQAEGSSASSGGTGSSVGGSLPGQGPPAEVPIHPVNRASLSTVSRILEGSVDAASMQ